MAAAYSLFDALDLRIRALDPNVYQEVLKLYVAYKRESNFRSLVPQARVLRLSLIMPFAELNAPDGMASPSRKSSDRSEPGSR